jgi:protein phosphatase
VKHCRIADIAGISHAGARRSTHDTIAWDAERGLALVADGVGGANAGEIASQTAALSITGDLRAASLASRLHEPQLASQSGRTALVQELIRRANQRIFAAALREPALNGMQTTLAMTLLADDFMTVASIGDSRIYRLRRGALMQLTRDHNVAAERAARGNLSPYQAARSTLRATLSRALGVFGSAAADIQHLALETGDRLMLCTDGLNKVALDSDIARLLAQDVEAVEIASAAIEMTIRRGSYDNVSVIVLTIA